MLLLIHSEGAGGDYLGIGATDLTFTSSSGPGDSMSVSITILDDNLEESTETILLEASILSDPQFSQFAPGGNTTTVNINDDEGMEVVHASHRLNPFSAIKNSQLV